VAEKYLNLALDMDLDFQTKKLVSSREKWLKVRKKSAEDDPQVEEKLRKNEGIDPPPWNSTSLHQEDLREDQTFTAAMATSASAQGHQPQAQAPPTDQDAETSNAPSPPEASSR